MSILVALFLIDLRVKSWTQKVSQIKTRRNNEKDWRKVAQNSQNCATTQANKNKTLAKNRRIKTHSNSNLLMLNTFFGIKSQKVLSVKWVAVLCLAVCCKSYLQQRLSVLRVSLRNWIWFMPRISVWCNSRCVALLRIKANPSFDSNCSLGGGCCCAFVSRLSVAEFNLEAQQLVGRADINKTRLKPFARKSARH